MFLIAGGILLLLGLIAGVGGAVVLVVFNAIKAFKRPDITDGLVNYWPIESGDMTDHVGSGSPTSSSSTSYVPNRYSSQNTALFLNDGSVSLPTGVYMYGAFTLMMWVYLNAYSTNGGGLFDCGNTPSPSDTISLNMDNTGIMNVLLYSSSSNFASIYGVQTVPLNTWTHIAVTWDGSKGYLYINGAVDSNTAGSGMPMNIARTDCSFGRFFLDNTATVNCYLDEIRIYNRYFIK